MKDFVLIFKLLMRDLYARRVNEKGKSVLSPIIVSMLALIPLVVILCVYVFMMAWGMPTRQAFSDLITAVLSMTQVIVVFMSIHTVISVLYSNSDAAFYNSLPFRQMSVFLAKFAVVYVTVLQYVALLAIPLSLSGGIGYAVAGRFAGAGDMFYGYFAILFVIVPFLPLLPLFVLTLLSMPIAYIASYFKGHTTLKSVLTVLSYIVIMAGYMTFISLMSGNGSASGHVENGVNITVTEVALMGLSAIAKVFYPNKAMIDLANGIAVGQNIGIMLACIVGMPALIIALSALFYKRISMRSLETHSENRRREKKEAKPLKLLPALMKKDFMSVVRNSRQALSMFGLPLIVPVTVVIMYFGMFRNMFVEIGSGSILEMLKLTVPMLVACVILSMGNVWASMAYTREGKSFMLTRSLPISAATSITSKLLLAVSVAGVSALVTTILAAVIYKFSALNAVLMFIYLMIMITGGAAVNIFFDMKHGNVSWGDMNELRNMSRNNTAGILPALLTMLLAIVPVAMAVTVAALGDAGLIKSTFLCWLVFWLSAFVAAVPYTVTTVYLLFKRGEDMYEHIGEREFVARERKRKNRGNMLPPLR